MFLRHLGPSIDIHGKFYGDRPRGTPPLGELNTTEVAKYSDFAPIKGYRKRCKIEGMLLLITNRKLHTSFRLVRKSVILNDLAVILRYFSEFGTLKRHGQKLFVSELTASSKFCSKFINSRFAAH